MGMVRPVHSKPHEPRLHAEWLPECQRWALGEPDVLMGTWRGKGTQSGKGRAGPRASVGGPPQLPLLPAGSVCTFITFWRDANPPPSLHPAKGEERGRPVLSQARVNLLWPPNRWPQTWWLNTDILSQFQRAGVQRQGISRTAFSPQAPEGPFLPLLAPVGSGHGGA